MNYLQAFERTVRVHRTDTAVVAEDGREFTYGEFDRRSTALAAALDERIPGERCATLALNGPPAVESMIAGQKRGAATVQLSFRGSAGELVAMAETAGAAGLVFDDANAETALEVLDRGDFGAAIHAGTADLDRDGVERYGEVLAGADEPAAGDGSREGSPDDSRDDSRGNECAIFFTSGTTSRPKAVRFDQEQLWLGAAQVVMEHGIEATDVALVTTPWYHMVTTDAWLYPHWLAGATTVLDPSFDPAGVLELIEAHDVTGLLAVPTQLDAIVDVQAGADYDVGSLSYVRTGGAIVPEALVERTASTLTEGVYNTYGLTEGGPNLTFAPPAAQDEHPGTIGKESFVWELRVVETAPLEEHPDPSATVDPGGRGEIIARSPGMADGYIDNPEAEGRTFFDGWLRTRDVARVDEDGFLYVVDRVDNMIVSGGENVYPAEVERALEDHDAVREACVVGLADDRWGEVVAAVVAAEEPIEEADLDAFCTDHERLADFKRPRRYAVTDEALPRTETGTLQRERIAEQYFESATHD